MLRDFVRQTSHYTIGNILATLAGLISFPILTRMLTVEQYGLMALITSSLGILVAIGKFGMQHSILRFYSDAKAGVFGWNLDQYYMTVVGSVTVLGAATVSVWLIVIWLLPASLLNHEQLRWLLYLTASLVLIRIAESAVLNIMKAREQSSVIGIYTVLKRYGVLGCIVVSLYFIARDLTSVFGATIVAELAGVVAITFVMLKGVVLRASAFSSSLLRAMLALGIPMIGMEVASILLNIGDRYFIQGFLGAQELGYYAAAYNLCEYIQTIVLLAVTSAVQPIYMRMWVQDGPAKTIEFIDESLHFYILAGIPMIAGLTVIGSDLVAVLATGNFESGARIIPWVIGGMILEGATIFLGAGLFLHKRGVAMAALVGAAAALNLCMNVFMVPRYGIDGAAITTFVSFIFLGAATIVVARRSVSITLPWKHLLKTCAIAYSMYVWLPLIDLESRALTILVQMLCGAIYYGVMITVFDRRFREALTARTYPKRT